MESTVERTRQCADSAPPPVASPRTRVAPPGLYRLEMGGVGAGGDRDGPSDTLHCFCVLAGGLRLHVPELGTRVVQTGEWALLHDCDGSTGVEAEGVLRAVDLPFGRAELVGEARQGRPLPVALACLECPRQSSSLYRSGRCGGRLMLRLESLLAFSGDSVAQVWRQRAEGCAILAEVLESPELRTPRPCRVNCCGAGQTQTIEAVARYLEANLDTHHTIAGLARRHFINECALKRGFREHFGATIFAYLRERRMERAADLLSAGERSVIEAANAVGYTNPSHFARAFREATGVNPGQLAGNRRREA